MRRPDESGHGDGHPNEGHRVTGHSDGAVSRPRGVRGEVIRDVDYRSEGCKSEARPHQYG